MPRGRHVQTSLSAGEFDPLLWSREDVSFFYNSARIIENAVPLPQGGAKRREGWRFRALQRGPITAIDLSGATITASNGGTAGNLTDTDRATVVLTTTDIDDDTIFEVLKVDLTGAVAVSLVDLHDAKFVGLPDGVSSAVLTLQSSADNSAWADEATFNVGNVAYDRRFADLPNTRLGTKRYWRVVVANPDAVDLGGAAVSISGLRFHVEAGYSHSGTVGNFSVRRLTSSIENEFILVFTAGCCDIYTKAGAWVAAVSVPHTDTQVSQIKQAPNLDTLIIYHEDQPTYDIQRLSSDGDWKSGELVFDTVTEFAFDDDATAGGENEIQFVSFASMGAGNKVLVELNGDTSAEITWNSNATTNAAAVETALESLSDITSVSVSVSEGSGVDAGLDIEFTGVDGKISWPIMIVDILTGSGTVVLSRKQFGKKDFDQLWSATRGYASCGTFYQGRHFMGGFKARKDLIIASRAGALFDFKEDMDPVAASPIVVAPNIDDQVTIHNIYPGRHLQIFTSSAELYIPSEPITIDNIALKVTSRHGSAPTVTPVDMQGGTLFVDRNGRALREYLFTDTEQSYSAEPVSLLAGHLMSSPRSLVLRRSRDVDEPTILLVANTGTDRNGVTVPAAMVVIDRAQQVTGFFRIATQGTPLDFATTQSGEAFAMVSRDLAGSAWNYLEQFDEAFMSDCSVSVSGSGSTIDVSDYPWLEGEIVEVHGDGLPLGAYTVASGSIDLGTATYASVAHVGLKQVPRIVLHPFKGRGETSPTMQNMRIFRALLQLERTGAAAITGHDGGRPREIPFFNYDSGTTDPTLEETLFTGPKRVSGMGKWQKEPTIEITQIEPMPFLLRSLTYDVRY